MLGDQIATETVRMIEEECKKLQNFGEKKSYLLNKIKSFKRSMIAHGSSYEANLDPSSPDLHNQVNLTSKKVIDMLYLEIENLNESSKNNISESHETLTETQTEMIKTSLTSGQIGFIFNWFFDNNIFEFKSGKDAVNFAVNHFCGKNGKPIAVDQAYKKRYNMSTSEKEKLKDMFLEIFNQLTPKKQSAVVSKIKK